MARRPTNKSIWLQVIGASLFAASLIVVTLTITQSGGDDTSYRLRAQTMLPENVSVRPGQVACPTTSSESPITYDETTALADVLRLYDGDLISVRFTLDSLDTPMPEALSFAAEWPEQIIGDAGPTCVFIVGADNTASVTWELLAPGTAEFELTGLPPSAPTTVEVWLVAANAQDGATFASIATPDHASDADVVDPVGGRLRVVRRGSAAPIVELDVSQVDVDDTRRTVVARVSNPNPTTRALDVILQIKAPGVGSWQVDSASGDGLDCTATTSLECRLGDLDDDDVITVTATLTPTSMLEPRAVTCDGPPRDSGFGFCIEAALTAGPNESVGTSASWLAQVARPADEGLLITVAPDPVITTSDGQVDVRFAVTSNMSSDLGSVRIVGSDCSTVERIQQALDDADVFLEPGETWQYACSLSLPESNVFRFDVAAITQFGLDISASYEDFAIIVDPVLSVASKVDGSRLLFEVTNAGRGVLFEVAIAIPGCDSIDLIDGDPRVLQEGDSVTFECGSGPAQLDGVIAYASGSDGSRIASTD